jgi:hypothetical protein
MRVMRLLPALVLAVLLGQVLFLSDRAYAWCMCDQACPQPRCQCSPYCAVSDPFQKDNSTSSAIQMRSLRASAPFDSALNPTSTQIGSGIRSSLNLVAIPQGLLKLQCQRLKEMLNV